MLNVATLRWLFGTEPMRMYSLVGDRILVVCQIASGTISLLSAPDIDIHLAEMTLHWHNLQVISGNISPFCLANFAFLFSLFSYAKIFCREIFFEEIFSDETIVFAKKKEKTFFNPSAIL